eukprot:403369253
MQKLKELPEESDHDGNEYDANDLDYHKTGKINSIPLHRSNKLMLHQSQATSQQQLQKNAKRMRATAMIKSLVNKAKLQKQGMAKMFKKPSVVLVCKKSARAFGVLFTIFLVLLVLILIFDLIAYFLTKIGATIVYIGVVYLIGRFLCMVSVFPGSFWFWRKEIEYQFSIENCVQLNANIRVAREFIQQLQTSSQLDRIDLSYFSQIVQALKKQLYFSMEAYNLIEVGKLNRIQTEFNMRMMLIKSLLTEVIVVIDGQKQDLWTMDINIQKGEHAYQDQGTRSFNVDFQFITENNGERKLEELIEQFTSFERKLDEFKKPQNLKSILKYWFGEKPLGTGDLMRSELIIKYNGQQFWVNSFDGKKIDCMLLKAQNQSNLNLTQTIFKSESQSTTASANLNSSDFEHKPTILFCNPNACYYEYLHYQTEWIDYYFNMGVNIVIWNYRCYGRSQKGKISLTALMKDGEKVCQYVRSNLVSGKIGVHGESLGGSVASYIAKKCKVDFVFSDRTFASLVDVAYWTFGGKFIQTLFKIFTRWNEQCWVIRERFQVAQSDKGDYITTPKLLVKNYMLDDKDFNSFKNSMIKLVEMYSDFELRNRLLPHTNRFDKVRQIMQKKQNDQSLNMDTNNSILPKSQYEKEQKKKLMLGGMTPNVNQVNLLNNTLMNHAESNKEQFGSKDFIMESAHVKHEIGSLNDQSQPQENQASGSSGFESQPKVVQVVKKPLHKKNNFSLQLPQIQMYGQHLHEPVQTDLEGMSDIQEKYSHLQSNRTGVSKSSQLPCPPNAQLQIKMSKERKIIQKIEEKYMKMEESSHQKTNFQNFFSLLGKIKRVFGQIDSAGKSLTSIIDVRSKGRLKIFVTDEQLKMFLVNLEIFGSIHPISSEENFSYLNSRIKACQKLRSIIDELSSIVSDLRDPEQSQFQGGYLFDYSLELVTNIRDVFVKIEKVFSKKIQNTNLLKQKSKHNYQSNSDGFNSNHAPADQENPFHQIQSDSKKRKNDNDFEEVHLGDRDIQEIDINIKAYDVSHNLNISNNNLNSSMNQETQRNLHPIFLGDKEQNEMTSSQVQNFGGLGALGNQLNDLNNTELSKKNTRKQEKQRLIFRNSNSSNTLGGANESSVTTSMSAQGHLTPTQFASNEPRPAFDNILEPTAEQIGHFILLQCGHNGYFSHQEKLIYERHLIESGFISENQLVHNGYLANRASCVTIDDFNDGNTENERNSHIKNSNQQKKHENRNLEVMNSQMTSINTQNQMILMMQSQKFDRDLNNLMTINCGAKDIKTTMLGDNTLITEGTKLVVGLGQLSKNYQNNNNQFQNERLNMEVSILNDSYLPFND